MGEEMEAAEKLVREKKLEVGAEASEGPGPLNFGGPVVDPLEAIHWDPEAVSAQVDRACLQVWTHGLVALSRKELHPPEYSRLLGHCLPESPAAVSHDQPLIGRHARPPDEFGGEGA